MRLRATIPVNVQTAIIPTGGLELYLIITDTRIAAHAMRVKHPLLTTHINAQPAIALIPGRMVILTTQASLTAFLAI